MHLCRAAKTRPFVVSFSFLFLTAFSYHRICFKKSSLLVFFTPCAVVFLWNDIDVRVKHNLAILSGLAHLVKAGFPLLGKTKLHITETMGENKSQLFPKRECCHFEGRQPSALVSCVYEKKRQHTHFLKKLQSA